jgi:hypothetical protein
MFDWFKKPNYNNVVKFPEHKAVPDVPYVGPSAAEKDPTIYYTIGHTDDNRISIKMGYTTLTMNKLGIQHLIDQLELYKNQLHEEDDGDEE